VIRDLQTLLDSGTASGLTDGQLLERFVARRDGAAFEAIVRRHGPMVWGVCRRTVRDHHDAEDAFQAAFLVLARKAASVVPGERLPNWLHGVACNTAVRARSATARRRLRERHVAMFPQPEVAPEELADDLAPLIDRELNSMTANYRLAIVLVDLEGMGHKEAADRLGWPVGTLSGRLSRARAMLARRLSRRGVYRRTSAGPASGGHTSGGRPDPARDLHGKGGGPDRGVRGGACGGHLGRGGRPYRKDVKQ